MPAEKTKKRHPKNSDSQMLLSRNWSSGSSYIFLAILTLICLVPFSGKAFNIDDPLFFWTAQQIVHHPLDPYGFEVVWYESSQPASEVIKNPPLAAYYMAAVGELAGWSERVLHFAFLLPALIVILGTYRLAKHFTQNRLMAAAATLLTPGFLVSSSTVMCVTMMLAAWILSLILWVEGMEGHKPWLLVSAALLIALCALTKYFGIALIPLLAAYSIAGRRSIRSWAPYLLIPVALLIAYQYWTQGLYGRGLLGDAAIYTRVFDSGDSILAKTIVGPAFVGGCALTTLLLAPLLLSRRKLLLSFVLAGFIGIAFSMNWIVLTFAGKDRASVATHLAVFLFGGVSVFFLSLGDWWQQKKDPKSLLLLLWVFGTFTFAAFANWTVNAQSVLSMIPATGILLARRVDALNLAWQPRQLAKIAVPLALSGIASLWITWADFELAESARSAAVHFREIAAGTAAR